MIPERVFTALVLWAIQGAQVQAQPHRIPVRQLPPAIAASAPDIIASIASLRALSSGRVFVHDPVNRRVVLLDASLRLHRVVADQTSATPSRYVVGRTGLFAYHGDSTLLLNGAALSMAVLDGDGNVGRIMGAPRPSDFGLLIGGTAGTPAFDGRRRLVYRSAGPSLTERIRLGRLGGAPPAESAAVVRFDFPTRRLDTVAYVRTYTPRIVPKTSEREGLATTWLSPILHPAPIVDDWAVLSNGVVAVVRGQDYHVDLFDADGRRVSAPKIPFQWRHLSDADRASLIDSSKALRARLLAQGVGVNRSAAPVPGAEPVSAGGATVTRNIGGTEASASAAREPPAEYVAPEELPEYQPAFAAGSARADADGSLWIRTIPPRPLSGGAIYDVVDARGTLIDRVQVPRNSAIAGFGPGGVIYLAQRMGNALHLSRHHYQPGKE